MNKIGESELIINSDGSVFHLHIKPEELADTVILVGDPGRVEMVSSFFESKEFSKQSREFASCTGRYNGKRITVLSTGIGTDNIDIVMNELDALVNIDFKTREIKKEKKSLTLLRIGTSGSVQEDIPVGTYVFSRKSVGFDGLLNWYADRDKYTIADIEEAFVEHMSWDKHLPRPYIIKADDSLANLFAPVSVKGMTISATGFYGPQGRILRLGLAMPDFMKKLISFKYGDDRITNIEMESSALAGLAAELGHKAGTICLIIADRFHKKGNADYKTMMNGLIKTALDKLSQ
jgi:Uridine phosphorylase